MLQQPSGDTAKQALAQRGMVISTNNDQARLAPLRFLKRVLSHGSFFSDAVMENRMDTMMVQVPFEISAHNGVFVDWLRVDNNNDRNCPRLIEIGQGLPDRSRSASRQGWAPTTWPANSALLVTMCGKCRRSMPSLSGMGPAQAGHNYQCLNGGKKIP